MRTRISVLRESNRRRHKAVIRMSDEVAAPVRAWRATRRGDRSQPCCVSGPSGSRPLPLQHPESRGHFRAAPPVRSQNRSAPESLSFSLSLRVARSSMICLIITADRRLWLRLMDKENRQEGVGGEPISAANSLIYREIFGDRASYFRVGLSLCSGPSRPAMFTDVMKYLLRTTSRSPPGRPPSPTGA